MYQYHSQQSSSFGELKSSINNATPTTTVESGQLLPLFDKISDSYPTAFSTSADRGVIQEQVSAPASADASPYMSEKECTEQPENDDPESPTNFNSKSRRTSLNKAERRAEHNAIERARRECLNSKFQQLAEALPNLQNHRRPSKGQIVEKALDWVKQNISKEDRYQYQIMQLQNENKRLMAHINTENKSGIITPPINTTSPSAASFSASFHPQQFPATSTPTTAIDTIQKTNRNVKMRPYSGQQEEMNMMNSMAPLNVVDWQSQNAYNFECVIPSVSSSSSSRPLRDDDNDSSSSVDEAQKRYIQMAFQDMSQCSFFEVNNQQGPTDAWCQPPMQQPSYPMNYVPTNPHTNLNFGHHQPYLS